MPLLIIGIIIGFIVGCVLGLWSQRKRVKDIIKYWELSEKAWVERVFAIKQEHHNQIAQWVNRWATRTKEPE